MGARSKARRRALDILFESELRGLPTGGTLADRQAAAHPPISDYTAELVRGVAEHADEIDQAIATHAAGWSLDRMPAVDRNLLRIGVYELRYEPDIPNAVVLSEAVSLARELSTDDSGSFVNGVLAAIAGVPEGEHTP
jgi:transcription antitermination protein NusB